MESPSVPPEWRAVVRKTETVDVVPVVVSAEEVEPVVFDLSKFFLEARASIIDEVRRYYHQALLRWSSLDARSKSLSPPFRHSTIALNAADKIDPVAFPILTGPIGSGTSQLIEYALKDQVCQERGGYYVHVKFDMRQHADPHRPFVVAWTAFADDVVRRGPVAIATIRNTMLAACESETPVLLEMIPALSKILDFRDERTSTSISTATLDETAVCTNPEISERHQSVSLMSPSPHDTSAGLQRFLFVFQKFLKAIARLEHPVVLILDDLQWADPSAIDFIGSILQDVEDIPGLFVIGTHDDCFPVIPVEGDISIHGSYFVRKLQVLRSNLTVSTIPVHNLDFDHVKCLLNKTLQQCSLFDLQIEEDFCQVVYRYTDGNITLMETFLQWLHQLGLLKKDSPSNSSTSFTYWTWSVDAIHRELAGHAKDPADCRRPFYVPELLNAFPTKMIELLKVCACLGCLHTEDTILEYVLEFPVCSMLSEIVKKGVLKRIGSGASGRLYCFNYDIFQMAAYDLIPASNLELFHLEIGRRLWRKLNQEELDIYLFVVLSQLILGRRLISRPKERYNVVSLCLHAGRKAAKLSNFRAASIYLNFGIKLLGEPGWKDEYDLALGIHSDACEMEMCTANFEVIETLVEAIMRHARSDSDKVQARTTLLYAFSVNDRQQECLDLGLQLLKDVGSPLPKRLNLLALIRELRCVQSLLKGKSNEYLKRLPLIEDEDVLAAMRILHLIFLPAILQRPQVSPFICLTMTKLTLKHGLCFMSPLAFVAYGIVCIGLSDSNTALRFGDLGLELLDQLQVREYVPRVFAAYYSCIYAWKYPMLGSLGPLLHAHRVGMSTGDIEYSFLCANLWCFMSYDAGLPLDEIQEQWSSLQESMKAHRQTSLIRLSVPWLQYIAYFQGENVDFRETETLLKDYVGESNAYAYDIYWWQAKTAYLFHDLDRADDLAFKANFWKTIKSPGPTSEHVYIAFLNGMIAFSMLMDTQRFPSVPSPRRSRRQYTREGKNMIRYINKYASWCPSNFLAMKILLQAELAAVKKQSEKVIELYFCAMALAKDNRNLFLQALASERAGRYCLYSLGETREALSHFNHALSFYTTWAAHRKVNHLKAELQEFLGKEEHNSGFSSAI